MDAKEKRDRRIDYGVAYVFISLQTRRHHQFSQKEMHSFLVQQNPPCWHPQLWDSGHVRRRFLKVLKTCKLLYNVLSWYGLADNNPEQAIGAIEAIRARRGNNWARNEVRIHYYLHGLDVYIMLKPHLWRSWEDNATTSSTSRVDTIDIMDERSVSSNTRSQGRRRLNTSPVQFRTTDPISKSHQHPTPPSAISEEVRKKMQWCISAIKSLSDTDPSRFAKALDLIMHGPLTREGLSLCKKPSSVVAWAERLSL